MLGMLGAVGLPHALARRTCQLAVVVVSDPASIRTIVTGSILTLIEGGLRRMFLSRLSGAIVTVISGVFLGTVLFYPQARSDQPPAAESRRETAAKVEPVENEIPVHRSIEIPAPRKLRVTAGRGGALMYALEKNGERIPVQRDVPDGLAKEVVRDLQWVVVTGIVDHHRVQEWFRKNGRRSTPPRAEYLYRRADLERQTLQKDDTWSAWGPVDVDAKLEILDNVPEVEEERVPEPLRVQDLIDPLPFLKRGAWRGVDVEEFLAPQRRDPQELRVAPQGQPHAADEGLLRGADEMILADRELRGRRAIQRRQPESPVLMLRQFDFAVEPGRTYRYRARVVLNDFRRSADKPGAWSEPTEPVTIPNVTP
jgi:hypothetical protein